MSWKENELNIGMYEFPFSFILKDYITTTYNISPKYKQFFLEQGLDCTSRVYCKLKGLLETNNKTANTITSSEELILRESVENFIGIKPLKYKNLYLDSQFCFCIKRGTCTMKFRLDKEGYCPGEQVKLIYEIFHSECKADISMILVELKHRLYLQHNDGCFCEVVSTVLRRKIQGNELAIALQNSQCQTLQFVLTDELTKIASTLEPTCNGRQLKSSYYLEISGYFTGLLMRSSNENCLKIPLVVLNQSRIKQEMNEIMQNKKIWLPKIEEMKAVVFTEAFFCVAFFLLLKNLFL